MDDNHGAGMHGGVCEMKNGITIINNYIYVVEKPHGCLPPKVYKFDWSGRRQSTTMPQDGDWY